MASTIPVQDVSAASSSSSDAKQYTIEQLKEHNSRDSLWMLLHGKVYDVTKFMDEHPGGDEVLLEEAGRDATEAFEDVGHSDEARAMLPKMLLGDFKGELGTKAKKAVAGVAGTTSSAGKGLPAWVLPLGLFVAYLSWRLFLA